MTICSTKRKKENCACGL